MSDYVLRLLDPTTDSDLYREAYHWRSTPKRHAQPDRMPLKTFTADDPRHLTIGLFNGELQAVYFLHETEPGDFQCHFTSQRNVPRGPVLEGARLTAQLLLENGATQLHAWVTERNRPLRQFLTDLGFVDTDRQQFPCQNDTDGGRLPVEGNQPSKTFVKYVLKGESPSG